MHQQKADLQLLCQRTEWLQFGIVIPVGDIRRRSTNQLEGVNGYKGDSGMRLFEIPDPVADPALDRGVSGCKIQSGRHIVCNRVEPFLNPAFGIFQAEVQRFSLCNR